MPVGPAAPLSSIPHSASSRDTKLTELFNVVADAGGLCLLENCVTFGATALETTNHGQVFISQETDTVADVLAV